MDLKFHGNSRRIHRRSPIQCRLKVKFCPAERFSILNPTSTMIPGLMTTTIGIDLYSAAPLLVLLQPDETYKVRTFTRYIWFIMMTPPAPSRLPGFRQPLFSRAMHSSPRHAFVLVIFSLGIKDSLNFS